MVSVTKRTPNRTYLKGTAIAELNLKGTYIYIGESVDVFFVLCEFNDSFYFRAMIH